MSNSGLTENQKNYQIARELAKTSPKEYFLSFLELLRYLLFGSGLAWVLHLASGGGDESFWTKSLRSYNDGNTYLFNTNLKIFEIEIFNLAWVGELTQVLSNLWFEYINHPTQGWQLANILILLLFLSPLIGLFIKQVIHHYQNQRGNLTDFTAWDNWAFFIVGMILTLEFLGIGIKPLRPFTNPTSLNWLNFLENFSLWLPDFSNNPENGFFAPSNLILLGGFLVYQLFLIKLISNLVFIWKNFSTDKDFSFFFSSFFFFSFFSLFSSFLFSFFFSLFSSFLFSSSSFLFSSSFFFFSFFSFSFFSFFSFFFLILAILGILPWTWFIAYIIIWLILLILGGFLVDKPNKWLSSLGRILVILWFFYNFVAPLTVINQIQTSNNLPIIISYSFLVLWIVILGILATHETKKLLQNAKKNAYITGDEPLDNIKDLEDLGQENLKTQIQTFSQQIKNFPPEILASSASVFAIDAPWGGGKSSFISLSKKEILPKTEKIGIPKDDKWSSVTNYLKKWLEKPLLLVGVHKGINGLLDTDILADLHLKDSDYPIWIDFNPWNFNNQTELLENFFETLDYEVAKFYGKRFGSLLARYVDTVSAEYETGTPIEGLKIKARKQLFGPQPLAKIKDEIKDRLRKINHKIIIVLDDIDRMSPDEVVFVLKLVKMISDFPQIIFILPMDYNKVARIVESKFKSVEYRNYLQKIVQTVIKLEPFEKEQLEKIFLHQVERFFKNEIRLGLTNENKEIKEEREFWENIMKKAFEYYYQKANGVKPVIITPRDIKQLANKIVGWFSSDLVGLKKEDYKDKVKTNLEKTKEINQQIDQLLATQVFVEKK